MAARTQKKFRIELQQEEYLARLNGGPSPSAPVSNDAGHQEILDAIAALRQDLAGDGVVASGANAETERIIQEKLVVENELKMLSDALDETKKEIASSGLLAPIVGHVGDGNFHIGFIIDPDDPAEMAKTEEINEAMVLRALALGGTCTGEHGVGYGKMHFLQAEHGESLSMMRAIKQALDPDNIMNPGKMLAP